MGEVNGDFDGQLNGGVPIFHAGDDDGGDDRVHEWELGLPNADDITPLTQGLIPLELLTAFNIKPEPYRTSIEVTQASNDTLSLLRGSNFKTFCDDEDESETKKQRRNDSPEDADSAAAEDDGSGGGDGGSGGGDGGSGGGDKAVKRTRLVWTPQLHKRFVDVVAHLGIKNAVPKTIMQLMNVEGLTRENVASHLQKYRLYLKRMQGGSFDGGSNSSSENNGNNGNNGAMSVPVMGMMGYNNGFESHYNHNHNHSQNANNNGSHYSNNNNNNNNTNNNNNHYHHHHHHHHNMYSNGNNGMMMMQSGNNKYGSVMSYHHPSHVGPSEN